MKKLLLPLILLVLGLGGGIGAGIFLAPPPIEEAMGPGPCGDVLLPEVEHAAAMPEGEDHPVAEGEVAATEEGAEPVDAGASTGFEYVRMSNQFVVPIVESGAVKSMVVLTISVEVTSGTKDVVFSYEPKMRDVFLQILFDHANSGGFDGQFTSAENMSSLRRALRLAGQEAVGEQVHDILITDILRQDV